MGNEGVRLWSALLSSLFAVGLLTEHSTAEPSSTWQPSAGPRVHLSDSAIDTAAQLCHFGQPAGQHLNSSCTIPEGHNLVAAASSLSTLFLRADCWRAGKARAAIMKTTSTLLLLVALAAIYYCCSGGKRDPSEQPFPLRASVDFVWCYTTDSRPSFADIASYSAMAFRSELPGGRPAAPA